MRHICTIVLKDRSENWSTYTAQEIPDMHSILDLGSMLSVYIYAHTERYPCLIERYTTIVEYPLDLSIPE